MMNFLALLLETMILKSLKMIMELIMKVRNKEILLLTPHLGTLDEEEALNDADYDDELKGINIILSFFAIFVELEEEGEMSIEELRRKYGMPLETTPDNNVR